MKAPQMKIQQISLTTDFSSSSRQAYATGADVTRRLGAKIELVHCVEYLFQYVPIDFQPAGDAFIAYRSKVSDQLEQEARNPAFEKARPTTRLLDGYGPSAFLFCLFPEQAKARGA